MALNFWQEEVKYYIAPTDSLSHLSVSRRENRIFLKVRNDHLITVHTKNPRKLRWRTECIRRNWRFHQNKSSNKCLGILLLLFFKTPNVTTTHETSCTEQKSIRSYIPTAACHYSDENEIMRFYLSHPNIHGRIYTPNKFKIFRFCLIFSTWVKLQYLLLRRSCTTALSICTRKHAHNFKA